MPRPSNSLLAIIIAPLILLMLVTAIISLHSARALETSRGVVNLTNEIIQETQELLILSQDAETGQRGFLITGNERYLEPYLHAQTEIPKTITRLKVLLNQNPAQLSRLNNLNGYVEVKLKELARTIELRRVKGFDAARAVVLDDNGQAAMDSIRAIANEMWVAENTLLEQRMDAARAAEQETFLITGSLFVILLVLSLGGGFIFLRNFNRLEEAENQLEVKAGLLQTTLDTVGEGIGAFDEANTLVASNQRFFEVFGFPPVLGQTNASLRDFINFDLEIDGSFSTAAGLPVTEAKPTLAIYERKDGKVLELYRSIMPGGGMVFTARDITETRQAENALRQAQKMESVGQLTGGVAHDFNNLLQIIMANLDLALRRVKEPELQKRLTDALTGAERGSKLTRQLLAFARRQPLKPESINLARLVRDLTDLLRRTLGEEIEIEETVAAGLWSALADRSQVENAIVNLAINARDAMPEGGRLTIEIGNAFLEENYAKLHEDIKPGQYVMIAVTDTGIGMSKETISRAFDPFFSTKPEGRGTGLGLSMVYGFAKQSGGHVKIYSEPNVGTTIKLYLPRSTQGETVSVIGSNDILTGHGEMILVVEDDHDVRKAVISVIHDLGYRTIEASNGIETLEILKSQEPIDLMFTDVVMPGELHGRKLAKEALNLRPDLKIIFTSGYTENSIIHHGRLDDGVHLISKPYRKEDLARKITSVLNEKNKGNSLAEDIMQIPEIVSPQGNTAMPAPEACKIVFAEDDALVRLATIDMLEDLGFIVHPAGDEQSALALVQSQKPDVFMVDVNLGKGDGRKLAEEAKKMMPDLKIIFATGRDPGDLLSRVPGAKILGKPYSLPELKAAFDESFA